MYNALYEDTNVALGIDADAEWASMDAVSEDDVTPALAYGEAEADVLALVALGVQPS